jgi:hypothetical protein
VLEIVAMSCFELEKRGLARPHLETLKPSSFLKGARRHGAMASWFFSFSPAGRPGASTLPGVRERASLALLPGAIVTAALAL